MNGAVTCERRSGGKRLGGKKEGTSLRFGLGGFHTYTPVRRLARNSTQGDKKRRPFPPVHRLEKEKEEEVMEAEAWKDVVICLVARLSVFGAGEGGGEKRKHLQ